MPRWFRKYFCIFWLGATTVVWFPYAAMLALLKRGGSKSMPFIQGTWSRWMLWAAGATLKVEGVEHRDPSQPIIFACNHQSTLDIPALLHAVYPVEVRFVAKKVIKYMPLFGWYLVLAGFIFIDRANKKAAIRSLQQAAAQIAAGTSIIIFPEGTRSSDGAILPFKKGPFALATMSKVPICPVAIEGSRQVMPKNTFDIQPGEIRVKFGAPIDPKPFGDDREALLKVVRERVIGLHQQIGGAGGAPADATARAGRSKLSGASGGTEEVEA